MPRQARIVIPGVAHHVTQRGNRKADVFFCHEDRQRFCQWLMKYATQYGLAIYAYCLMDNHVHLVCVPAEAGSLAGALRPLALRHAQHINWSQNLTGRLWQGRFFSCPLGGSHLWASIRYVERNPVRAGIVSRAEDYPWSSAPTHCGMRTDPLLSPLASEGCPTTDQWSNWLAADESEDDIAAMRHHTQQGLPLGGDAFVAHLEKLVGRPLRPRRVGRPHLPRSTEEGERT